jgi:hypothetical protein
MDFYLIFLKEVVEKYQIDKILSPINLGNGELENVILSDLRRELDFCFIDIDSYTLKEKLIDYIEDYLLQLRIINIPSKKTFVRSIKKSIKKLEKQHPNLDINNDEDEIIIDEISKKKWQLHQEEYILAYLKEQQYFIRSWVSETRKELLENPLKEWVKKERSKAEVRELLDKFNQKKQTVIIPKTYHFYCQIGVLFVQNHIYRKRADDELNYIYFYKEEEFVNANQLSKYIKEKILKTEKSVNQYLGDTLNDNDTPHNFYNSKTKQRNILQYCKDKGIEIINEKFI